MSTINGVVGYRYTNGNLTYTFFLDTQEKANKNTVSISVYIFFRFFFLVSNNFE